RSPMITAYIAWDLQKASGGRMILGLGSQVKGHNERRFSVKFESPGPKLREQVLAIRTIWNCWQTGAKLDFKGEFYRFDLMTPMFNPDRKSTRLNSSHVSISYAVFCLKKKKTAANHSI